MEGGRASRAPSPCQFELSEPVSPVIIPEQVIGRVTGRLPRSRVPAPEARSLKTIDFDSARIVLGQRMTNYNSELWHRATAAAEEAAVVSKERSSR